MHRQLRVPRNFLKVDSDPENHDETMSDSDEPVTSLLDNPSKVYWAFEHKLFGYAKLKLLAGVTSLVHFVSAAVVMISYKSTRSDRPTSRIQRTAVCWGESMTQTNHIDTDPSYGWDRIDSIAWLIFSFFALSGVFQLFALLGTAYETNIRGNKPQYWRYVEYSVSASLMMVSIFMSFGLLDSYLHLCVFWLTFLCMMLGLTADVIRHHIREILDDRMHMRQLVVNLHYVSWIAMLVPWIILLCVIIDFQNHTFEESCNRISFNITAVDCTDGTTTTPISADQNVPTFVWVIFLGLGILFNLFGFVQRWQFNQEFDFGMFSIKGCCGRNKQYLVHRTSTYDAETTGVTTEAAFLTLSLTAKLFLGWVIFWQVLVA
jgi:hypothetical protein